MRVDEAEQHLRDMLVAAGLDLARLEPRRTWQVWKEFAAQPVEGIGEDPDDDMVDFSYGTRGDEVTGEADRFVWELCRQFSLYREDGEYDHTEQLWCNLDFEPTPELEQLGEIDVLSGAWLAPTSWQLDEWVAFVEQLDGHAAVLGTLPVRSEISQWEV